MTTTPEGETHPVLFALGRSGDLALRVAACLRVDLSAHEERDFEDGEHKIRPLVGVRGRDVYVLADLAGSAGQSVNDKLVKLLFFVGALKQSGARSATVVAPYLCYARKERQTKPRDPVATRYLAQMLEAVGVDRIVAVAAHDLAAFQNAFRCESVHLDAHALFAEALAARLKGIRVAVVSPDPGGEKRADLFRLALEARLGFGVGKALVDKTRSGGVVTGELFAGEIEGRVAIVIDDMIATGGTMARAAQACRAHGVRRVIAVATHGLFTAGSDRLLASEAIDDILVSDSLPAPAHGANALQRGRLQIVSLAPLLAGAIRACRGDGSITALLEGADKAL